MGKAKRAHQFGDYFETSPIIADQISTEESSFFTVVLADRSSHLLTEEIERLRRAYRTIRERHPFETIAICVLPDHVHTVWALPEHDKDFASRWSLFGLLGLPIAFLLTFGHVDFSFGNSCCL